MTSAIHSFGRRAWLPLAIVLLWWAVTASGTSIYFPPPTEVAQVFARDWLSQRALSDLLPSLRNLVLGFGLAALLGTVGGILLGSVPWAAAMTAPIVHFVRSMPPPVLLPLALLMLGTGTAMKVAIIAAGALWPTLLNAMDGVRSVDPQLRRVSASYRLTVVERIRYVFLPAAAPQIAVGLRTTLQISIILIVVSEMVASTGGIGYYVLQSQQTFSVPETWAGTLLLGLVGFLCNLLFGRVERNVLHWHYGPMAQKSR